jgi:hypothetical protein
MAHQTTPTHMSLVTPKRAPDMEMMIHPIRTVLATKLLEATEVPIPLAMTAMAAVASKKAPMALPTTMKTLILMAQAMQVPRRPRGMEMMIPQTLTDLGTRPQVVTEAPTQMTMIATARGTRPQVVMGVRAQMMRIATVLVTRPQVVMGARAQMMTIATGRVTRPQVDMGALTQTTMTVMALAIRVATMTPLLGR